MRLALYQAVFSVLAVAEDELSKLATKYGTDKVTHRYTQLYDRLFGGQRTTLRRFLEVGVYRGASMQMWRDYFTSAEVYGLDSFRNQLSVLKKTPASSLAYALRDDHNKGYNFSDLVLRGKLGSRLHVIDANQSDAAQMAAVVRDLGGGGPSQMMDLIVEDGSHIFRDQQTNLAWLLPLVRPGGVYVIEDITSSSQPTYYKFAPANGTFSSDQTTLRVMQHFNRTLHIKSKHLSAQECCYLDTWIASAEVIVTRGKTHSSLCVVRKRETPRPAGVCSAQRGER